MKPTENKVEKTGKRVKCGVLTCIHCVMNTCMVDACDMQEKTLMQEG
ncbi:MULTISPECIES: hypothetical protein [Anoxynatronum]|uniref:Uncharacterized protein n=2 Tax=Anoxynatronum TaxID=210622 RepID=A0AA45WSW4_9CLOT|nr:hypothetical protein [Anoxynatronum buryatiense]SMP39779.1 hypothetical protein SAMN06296020_101274 [Anoxynatronum buryatiense]